MVAKPPSVERRSISASRYARKASGSSGSGEPVICFAHRGERRQHAGGVDVAPLEGQQGDAVLDARARAGR